ncbi:MAG: hypothetical protein KJN93_03385 [Alphaproteobacteria bacterium]|nr:hypothetical protein [Alphaproteobacteria bacterium]NNF24136.1 hypothetical protein [Paracoccaceae bacterium]
MPLELVLAPGTLFLLVLLCPTLIVLCRRPAAQLPLGYLTLGLCVLVPVLAAAEMGYLFLYLRAPRVVQFAAGSERAMDLWSIWVDHFLILFALCALWSAGNLIGLAIDFYKKRRELARIFGAGSVLSALAFAAVAMHFPSA